MDGYINDGMCQKVSLNSIHRRVVFAAMPCSLETRTTPRRLGRRDHGWIVIRRFASAAAPPRPVSVWAWQTARSKRVEISELTPNLMGRSKAVEQYSPNLSLIGSDRVVM